ncbi:MAG: di-trans,poly-cis-decaprenylcistransferase [Bacteroidales bacterium]|jgi:undecaprenyl diphosphate synthase|nr:di-trans,poly-cis-decaprenylcistransferase [Bacteroidales bacterium]
MATLEQIDKTRSPKSVAIIMDGNGRWARQRGMDRSEGHKAGIDSLHDSIEAAKWAGVKYLTVYAFSTENWNRPQKEVDTLMNLIAYAVELETPDMIRKGVRLGMIGDFSRVPKFAMDKLKWSIEQTKDCQDITLIIALSYSARWELVDTMQRLARQCVEGAIKPEEIDQEMISRNLTTSWYPDPDLLIRTGGEERISNFMLWQISYSELYFTPVLWPDFHHEQFYDAIVDYQSRERRFGKTSAQVQAEAGTK